MKNSIIFIDFSWGVVRENYPKSVGQIFHFKNEIFYYGVYNIKMTAVAQRNISNCFFQICIYKILTFRPKTVIKVIKNCAIVLVKMLTFKSTIRSALKNATKKYWGMRYDNYDLDSRISQKRLTISKLSRIWAAILNCKSRSYMDFLFQIHGNNWWLCS